MEDFISNGMMANMTHKYDQCMKCFWCQININEEYTNKTNTYLKVKAPDSSTLKSSAKYPYAFEFAMSEKYAVIWQQKRIEFLNDIAKNWTDPDINKFEAQGCVPPGDSTDLRDVSRCQQISADEIVNNKELKLAYDTVFIDKVLQVSDQKLGTMNVLTDVVFEESVA